MGDVEEKDFILLDEKWGDGICVDRYKNEVSICLAKKNEQGEVWKTWGFIQKPGKVPADKSMPWKVTLGVEQQALQLLDRLALIVRGVSES